MSVFSNPHICVSGRFFAWILPCLLFIFTNTAQVHKQRIENHSTVIIKIPDMEEAQYSGILDGISRDNQFTFEYACKESNIIVVKYYHSHREKADIRLAATSSFRKWGKVSKMEVIYVDFMKGSTGKC